MTYLFDNSLYVSGGNFSGSDGQTRDDAVREGRFQTADEGK
jgi:hypothetical protein